MALKLTRKIRRDGDISERRIMIGDNIILTLCEANGNQVVFSIEAPDTIRIAREELMTTAEILAIEAAARANPR